MTSSTLSSTVVDLRFHIPMAHTVSGHKKACPTFSQVMNMTREISPSSQALVNLHMTVVMLMINTSLRENRSGVDQACYYFIGRTEWIVCFSAGMFCWECC